MKRIEMTHKTGNAKACPVEAVVICIGVFLYAKQETAFLNQVFPAAILILNTTRQLFLLVLQQAGMIY